MRDAYWTVVEINDYLNDPRNAIANVDDPADVLADIGEQMRTDDLVEDSFLEALRFDASDYYADDMDDDEFCEVALNTPEIADLCDLVEAAEKGYIIYG